MAVLFGIFSSPMEWGVVALLALLFFGNRLPSVMRNLGEGVTEFKKGMNGHNEPEEDEEDYPRQRRQPPRKLEDRANADRPDDLDRDDDVRGSLREPRQTEPVRKPEERPVS